jgi:hypothetical protein
VRGTVISSRTGECIMTVFDALLSPVMPILHSIEQQRRTHGNETLRWLDFVRILVFFFPSVVLPVMP